MNFVKADRNQASEWALPSGFGLPSRGERVARTLDEVGLRAAANVLVALDLVASVGAAGAVVFDCVLLLEARVSGCAPRAPRRPHAAQYSADRACRQRASACRRSRQHDSGIETDSGTRGVCVWRASRIRLTAHAPAGASSSSMPSRSSASFMNAEEGGVIRS